MNDDNRSNTKNDVRESRGFLASLLAGLVRDAINMIFAFAIGTGAGAVVCWYYGIPLAFSIIGGILVLGLALAFTSDSLFS
jgi:phosphate/sulfate permease